MKTVYEKMYKYEFNSWIFGKPKLKYAKFYIAFGLIIPVLALIAEYIFG